MKRVAAVAKPIEWPRADPAELAKFDQRTKVCTMNCGPSSQDPRKEKERRFLCDDCLTREAPNGEVRGASRLAGEASSAEGATSTVVLGVKEK